MHGGKPEHDSNNDDSNKDNNSDGGCDDQEGSACCTPTRAVLVPDRPACKIAILLYANLVAKLIWNFRN